jgi:ribonucleoside-diphosphate reductase alpha chain
MEAFLSEFTYLRTYARFLNSEGRRETYPETVNRNCDWVFSDSRIPEKVRIKTKQHMMNRVVFPSMRSFWASGGETRASDKDNALIYNCSFLGVDCLLSFSEALYLLMCGTGVGYSIEAKYLKLLPVVAFQKNKPVIHHTVEDSREGWKFAFEVGLNAWFEGRDCYFDYSLLRKKGAPLYTMGGRSSGGEVFRQLLEFARELILGAQGRRLTSLECHHLMCQIGAIVVVGGTRRSALICLSDLSDEDIRNCKQPGHHPRLYGANNSAVYYDKPSLLDFLDEWVALAKSGMGERGIANLYAARKNAPHRRKSKLIQGLNPCGEVALQSRQFCNLTSVVVKPTDDYESLRDKITSACWLGVCQSTFTHFPYLSKAWKENTEEERLCGVSLSGQQDNPGLLTPDILKLLKQHAINTCRKAAKVLDINMPAAITTTKPEGSCSLVAGSSAGCHPRWAEYYVKSVQISVTDPLFHLMADSDVPYMIPQTNGQSTAIIGFPIKSPEGALTRHDMTAIDQLEWYSKLLDNYIEHNVSNTVYVAHDEWLKVADWVYDHFDQVCGVSFFPKETGATNYDWLPFKEIDKAEYEKLCSEFPDIDFGKLPDYEKGLGDQTIGSKEIACAGGACEL